jgi:hypothetical protein
MPITTCTPRPPTVSRRRHVVLAAEPRAAYRTPPTAAVPGPTTAAPPAAAPGPTMAASAQDTGTTAPFGLPVLAELPALAATLGDLVAADRAMLSAVSGLAELLESDEVATATGVAVEQWIAIVARHTRLDRRLLLRTARLLRRFPALQTAVDQARLSWPQLRGLSLALREVPTPLDERVDGFLAELLPHLDGADPDAVVRQIERAIVEWRADIEPVEPESTLQPYLQLQPRLDGTGGRLRGEFDAAGLAMLDGATAPRRDQLDHPGGLGGARAENLLARLAHACPPVVDDADASSAGDAAVEDLEAAGMPTAAVALPPPRLLLRWDLDALLDRRRTPADLLTRLMGGSLRMTATAARRLLDERGAEVRSIVLEQGEVIGVGRATRIPPGWLREAALALHSTCTGPLCDRPARGADLDHAIPWWPAARGDPLGTTDLSNLGPLCATTNRAKEAAGWRATQRDDGRRTWTHPRTGLSITSIPATWRPPPDRSP